MKLEVTSKVKTFIKKVHEIKFKGDPAFHPFLHALFCHHLGTVEPNITLAYA